MSPPLETATELEHVGFRTSQWWKCSEYRVDRGFLRPVPGAPFKAVNPWETFFEERRKSRTTPYLEFLELFEKVQFRPSPGGAFKSEELLVYPDVLPYKNRRFWRQSWRLSNEGTHDLTQEAEEALLAWARSYGLLGLALHETRKIVLAPRWVYVGSGPLLKTYRRFRAEWDLDEIPGNFRNGIARPGDLDRVAPRHSMPPDWPTPHVEARKTGAFEWSVRPIPDFYGIYFPDVVAAEKQDFAYPMPGSHEFWESYAEPVDRVLDHVIFLRESMRLITNVTPEDLEDEEDILEANKFAPSEGVRSDALLAVNALLDSVNPYIYAEEDGPVQRWATPSFFVAMTLMATIDLTDNVRRFLMCPVCGKFFNTPAYQSVYCDATCKKTDEKRRSRAKQREARELRKQGLSISAIAKNLNTPEERIANWLGERGSWDRLSAAEAEKKVREFERHGGSDPRQR